MKEMRMPVVLPLIRLKLSGLGWQGTIRERLKGEGEFIVQVSSKARTMTYYVKRENGKTTIKNITGQSIPKRAKEVVCCERCKTPLEFPEYCYKCGRKA